MVEIYDANLERIGEIPISLQQLEALYSGATVTVNYHRPRMLRELMPETSGSFEVREDGGKLIGNDPEQAKRYMTLQVDIAAAMKQPKKWIDPDAESNAPIR